MKEFTVIVKEVASVEIMVNAENEAEAKAKALKIAMTQDLEWESDEGIFVSSVFES